MLNSLEIQSLSIRKSLSAGNALTELLIVLPVTVIFLHGVVKMSSSFQSTIDRHTLKLQIPLSSQQIPEDIQRASRWPRHFERAQNNFFNHALSNQAYVVWSKESNVLVRSPHYSTGPVKSLSHFENRPVIRERWNNMRLRRLGILRATCLAEGSATYGPQGASGLLLGLSTLPTSSARERLVTSLCPWVSRGSKTSRNAAVLGAKLISLNNRQIPGK